MEINSYEFDLIARYLKRAGFRVKDVTYYDQSFTFVGDGTEEIGNVDGFIPGNQFFFGNITIEDSIQGVVVLANENLHLLIFSTLFFGGVERESCRISMGVGYNMHLLGNGHYYGIDRLYGVGCNRVTLGRFGCGASTVACTISLNGYIFVTI